MASNAEAKKAVEVTEPKLNGYGTVIFKDPGEPPVKGHVSLCRNASYLQVHHNKGVSTYPMDCIKKVDWS